MTDTHPLVPLTDRGLKVQANSRPRFTMSEVLLLNAVLNAAPEPVAINDLRHLLSAFAIGRQPTRGSILQHVVALRAKLGEPRSRPRQLLSVSASTAAGWRQVVGFRWQEDEAHG